MWPKKAANIQSLTIRVGPGVARRASQLWKSSLFQPLLTLPFTHHLQDAGLLDLPTELLLSISKCLEYETDVNGFSQVNHFLYDLVNPQLYRHDAFDHDSALDWAAQHGKEACVRRLLKAGVPPDWGMEEWQPIMLAAKKRTCGCG